eukprot:TRINITY_DN2026_c0_g1_i1.p2 TRINITY_DN2026_c0_g1~~TRINITY_DN2026_c0_g1_i1.p2  ORF type:complete len:135 (+),score=31.87 TRINITY_DN2026_c0_g1_i1:67-471(+)
MAQWATQSGAQRRRNGKVVAVATAAIAVAATASFCLEAFLSPSTPASQGVGRRDALWMGSGLAASALSAGWAPNAWANAAEVTPDEEVCLSECVYKCTGGARGKGSEYVPRKDCILECREKCLPKAEEESVEIS